MGRFRPPCFDLSYQPHTPANFRRASAAPPRQVNSAKPDIAVAGNGAGTVDATIEPPKNIVSTSGETSIFKLRLIVCPGARSPIMKNGRWLAALVPKPGGRVIGTLPANT